MDEEADGLFVIDKSGGGSDSKTSRIIYDPAIKEDLGETPVPSNERPSGPARPRRPVTGKRYHEVGDFSKFRPGSMSDELRHALNLATHELPIHIYRMRTLGYPPGWLRKARSGTELTMFDSVAALAEDSEVTYNRDLLVSFMGFNTQIEYPFIDECDALNCPRMQSHHMLDNFYAALSRSARFSSGQNNGKPSSADIERLRTERERILAEIRQLDSKVLMSQGVSESGDNQKLAETPETDAANAPNGNANDNSINGINPNHSGSQLLLISASEDGTPTPSRPSGIVDGSNADGTPSQSSSSKRPNIDAFSVGVQPFRPFENLPGTEGAYKRVLETLRNSRNETSFKESPSASRDSNRDSNHSASSSAASFKTSTPHRRSYGHQSPYQQPYSRSPHKSRRYY